MGCSVTTGVWKGWRLYEAIPLLGGVKSLLRRSISKLQVTKAINSKYDISSNKQWYVKYLTLRYKIYKVHKDIMGRIAGVPNKITSEVKEKLQLLIDELIESLEINKLDTNQRIKMLQIALQYTLPRLQSMVVRDEVEVDFPLFVE